MEEGRLKILQGLGEETAYTFKGLYKESDWLEWQYKLYLSVPIFVSVVALGFDQELPKLWIKILTGISLGFIFLALLGQKRFESVDSYRRLANEIKAIYDRAKDAYFQNDTENISELREQWDMLREQTQRYPIRSIGRCLSKRLIKKEMNLSWLGGEYSEQSPASKKPASNG